MFKKLSLFIAFCFVATAAGAEDFDSTLKDARKAYQADDNLEAFKSLRQAIFSVWDNIPLTVLEAELVTDQRSYTPKENNVYSSGEPIYIVCQVVGYNIKEKDNLHHVNITSDFQVLAEKKEKVLIEKKNFYSFDLTSPFPNSEFKLDLKYSLNAPPGKYIIRTGLRDQNSDKKTEFTKTVVIE